MAHKLNVTITVDVFNSAAELSPSETLLLARAEEATKLAYAPYSGFLVGAALLLEDGTITIGNNQENAAYPSGLCAERSALFGLRSNEPDKKIKLMAVTARRADTTEFVPAMPCGACRQVMTEYENKQVENIPILMQGPNGQVFRLASVSDLLPLQFSKLDLLVE